MTRIRRIIKTLTLAAVAALLPTACSDDIDLGPDGVPEGRPASIRLSWSVAAPAVATRAISDEEFSYVETLWVGIYNVNTGRRAYAHTFTCAKSITNHTLQQLDITGLTSGTFYIVAVANPDYNYGIYETEEMRRQWAADEGNAASGGNETTCPIDLLSHWLDAADTWAKFNAIATVQIEPTNISRDRKNVPMTGTYYASAADPPGGWGSITYDDIKVTIFPGSNTLGGAIHLRRQEAYVKFNLFAHEYITINPLSWRVVNIPVLSPLFEGAGNFGDTSCGLLGRSDKTYADGNYAQGLTNVQFSDFAAGKATDAAGSAATYRDAATYGNNKAGDAIPLSGSSFDFYLYGNKRTGTATTYAAREEEYKVPDAAADAADAAASPAAATVTNSGIYKSLVTPDEYAAYVTDKTRYPANNRAAYVVFTTEVNYWYDTADKTADGHPTYAPVDPTVASADDGNRYIHRSALGTFTVHLGYCEGDDDATRATDFNVRRNYSYTYNVFINGVDKIRVEAIPDGSEVLPGVEGSVSDLANETFLLDGHYATMNIELLNSERVDMNYNIRAFDKDGQKWEYSTHDTDSPVRRLTADDYYYKPADNPQYPDTWHNDQLYPADIIDGGYCHYYDWIEFLPTIEKDKLSPYRGAASTPVTPWSLAMLGDPAHYPGLNADGTPDAMPDTTQAGLGTDSDAYKKWANTLHYYTVFVNEYVYYWDGRQPILNDRGAIAAADGSTRWHYFTDKPTRLVWLINNADRDESVDKESTYLVAKYLFSQKSIETYYSTVEKTADRTNISPSAIGLERDNENFGIDLRWGYSYRQTQYPTSGYDNSNGRYNMWRAFNYSQRDINNVADAAIPTTVAKTWADILDYDGNYLQQEYIDGKNVYVPKLRRTGDKTTGDANSSITPNSTNVISAMEACMSRNRDINGDGKIDASELRWYLPAMRMYLRIIIGSEAIGNPLWDFSQDEVRSGISNNVYWGNAHVVSSNYQMLWAEEGMSITTQGSKMFGSDGYPWQLRCVRNLGLSVNTVSRNETVRPAYDFDKNISDDGEERWIFTMTYYDALCDREPTLTEIGEHIVGDSRNRTSYQFEIGRKGTDLFLSKGNTARDGTTLKYSDTDAGIQQAIDDGICEKVYGNGWRVPNFQELALMMLLQNNSDSAGVYLPLYDIGMYGASVAKYNYLSCTKEKYRTPTPHFLGCMFTSTHNSGNEGAYNGTAGAGTSTSGYTQVVRCVRDILIE